MQYLNMLPSQLREAIDKNYPVALPLGVIEYHAEHLPFGVDCFTCIDAINRIEKRRPELVLPPFYYGAASLAVAKPERNGTIRSIRKKSFPWRKKFSADCSGSDSGISMRSSRTRPKVSTRECRPIWRSGSPRVM